MYMTPAAKTTFHRLATSGRPINWEGFAAVFVGSMLSSGLLSLSLISVLFDFLFSCCHKSHVHFSPQSCAAVKTQCRIGISTFIVTVHLCHKDPYRANMVAVSAIVPMREHQNAMEK
jgi:hypothetical protein